MPVAKKKNKKATSPEKRELDEVVEDIRAALIKLDHYRYNEPNTDEAAAIEGRIRSLQKQLQPHHASLGEKLETYPEYSDPNFYKNIYAKKEFNKSVYPAFDILNGASFEEVANEQCSSGFKLSKNQAFIKNFISPRTPYNGILLFHGVGVGKTCAAISIAEQFHDVFDNPVLVLAPSNLSENFKKQLFDSNRPDQCTGRKYLSKVPHHEHLDKEAINKHVNRLIRENYKFSGFIEFANHVETIESTMIEKYGKLVEKTEKKGKGKGKEKAKATKVTTPMAEAKINAQLKKEYSNRVIIIDEVHNVRSDKDDPKKKTPVMLMRVLQSAVNIKLVMLTATPMFNDTREIVWLINFLLANDKRPLIESSDCFDESGLITKNGAVILSDAAKGYVSYMRGDNPFTFPARLYASVNDDERCLTKKDVPRQDLYNKKIEKDNRLSLLVGKIITHEMEGVQDEMYKETIISSQLEEAEEDETETPEDEDTDADADKGTKNRSMSRVIQISNIVYPTKAIGRVGFEKCFETVKEKGGGGLKGYRYRKLTDESKKKKPVEFLAPDHLDQVSSKLKSIVDYILNSEGIVYVYSFYIYSALLPLALALEHVGFKRSNGKSLLLDAEEKSEMFKVNGKQARYALLSRDADLYTDIAAEVSRIRSPKNMNGEEVKVILGTNVTAEGIDFKNIRQIHIVEPWFHLNKLEQVVGRAVRKCSHIDLPIEKRNVTIYYHASVTDKKQKESIDLRIYRIAEGKEKAIKEVERVLMSAAVDCPLNKNVMSFPREALKMRVPMLTSQGTQISDYKIGDDLDDKHVGLQCLYEPKKGKVTIDDHTFHPSFYVDEFEDYGRKIAELFKTKETYTFEEIHDAMAGPVDEDVLKYALEHMLVARVPVKNSEKITGFLVYYGQKYLFQPADAPDAFLTLGRRNMYRPLAVKEMRITQKNVLKHTKSMVATDEVIQTLTEKVKKLTEKFPDFEQEVVDYCIDRLGPEEAKALVLSVHTSEEKGKMKNRIRRSLIESQIYVKVPSLDTYIFRDVSKAEFSDELVPQDVLAKFGVKENEDRRMAVLVFNGKDELENLSMSQMASVLSDKTLKTARDALDGANIKGYMGTNSEGQVFKIFGDEEKSNGFVCGTNKFKVDDYKSRILELDPKALDDESVKRTKASLCVLFEMLLRKKASDRFLRPYGARVVEMKKKATSKGAMMKKERAKRGRPKK